MGANFREVWVVAAASNPERGRISGAYHLCNGPGSLSDDACLNLLSNIDRSLDPVYLKRFCSVKVSENMADQKLQKPVQTATVIGGNFSIDDAIIAG